MIRLRPTSIALSERDLQSHLRQIDLYQHLLAEGFKKEQIRKYYDEQQTLRRGQENLQDEVGSQNSSYKSGENVDELLELDSGDSIPVAPPQIKLSGKPVSGQNEARPDKTQVSSMNSSTAPQPTSFHRSTVRQSSLLRIMHNASQASSESPGHFREPDSPEFLTSTNTSGRYYRARSLTCSWLESEADLNLISGNSRYQHLTEQFNDMSLNSRAEPDVSEIMDESFTSVPNASRVGSPLEYSEHVDSTSHISANIEFRNRPVTPVRRSSLIATRITSPASSESKSSVSLPPLLEATPSTSQYGHLPRTEPRNFNNRSLHSTISVYNDAVPASMQPQTPADLARSPMLTHRDAAYTAPPGNVSRSRPSLPINQGSPTNRAAEIRHRRTREFLRSGQVEALRSARILADAEHGILQDNDEDTLWRDELDADRVGEENF